MSGPTVTKVGPFTVVATEACPRGQMLIVSRRLVLTGNTVAVMGDDGVPRAQKPGDVVRVVFADEAER